MKKIWQDFTNKCKAAWKTTCESISSLYKIFVADIKAIIVQCITLLENALGKTVKVVEVVAIGLLLTMLTAFFTAVYDTVVYILESIKDTITFKKKK